MIRDAVFTKAPLAFARPRADGFWGRTGRSIAGAITAVLGGFRSPRRTPTHDAQSGAAGREMTEREAGLVSAGLRPTSRIEVDGVVREVPSSYLDPSLTLSEMKALLWARATLQRPTEIFEDLLSPRCAHEPRVQRMWLQALAECAEDPAFAEAARAALKQLG